jgi:hypothetical protein
LLGRLARESRLTEVAILGKLVGSSQETFRACDCSSQHNSSMMAQQLTQRKQQGEFHNDALVRESTTKICYAELQLQYTNYKNGLQQIAQKIGDVEQEAEEHSA